MRVRFFVLGPCGDSFDERLVIGRVAHRLNDGSRPVVGNGDRQEDAVLVTGGQGAFGGHAAAALPFNRAPVLHGPPTAVVSLELNDHRAVVVAAEVDVRRDACRSSTDLKGVVDPADIDPACGPGDGKEQDDDANQKQENRFFSCSTLLYHKFYIKTERRNGALQSFTTS